MAERCLRFHQQQKPTAEEAKESQDDAAIVLRHGQLLHALQKLKHASIRVESTLLLRIGRYQKLLETTDDRPSVKLRWIRKEGHHLTNHTWSACRRIYA